jgi:hypothetical protein
LPEYTKKILPQKRIRTNSAYSNFLVPYFSSEKLYFVDDEIVRSIFANGEAKIKTDHTISFDTNFASHINSVVRGEKIKGGNHEDYGLKHQKKIIQIIENLINDDLNFNHIFYLLENIKLVYPVISKITAPISALDFWSMLEKDFRRNLVSLELFRGIDCQKYRRTSSPESKFTFQQAARNVIKSAHYFYMSGIGIRGINELLRLQRLSLLYLIGIYKVEFTSTKSQEKERKTEAFFDYIQDVIGIYLDRESIMAHK